MLTWDLIKSSLTKSGTRLKWLGSSSSNQGSSLCPLQWKCRVLTTGLLEISQCCWVFLLLLFLLLLSSLWIFCELFLLYWGRASLVAQTVKNLPAVQEIWVWSLGWNDPLKRGMATPSNILSWRIPWTEEPGGLQSMGLQRIGHSWVTNLRYSQLIMLW